MLTQRVGNSFIHLNIISTFRLEFLGFTEAVSCIRKAVASLPGIVQEDEGSSGSNSRTGKRGSWAVAADCERAKYVSQSRRHNEQRILMPLRTVTKGTEKAASPSSVALLSIFLSLAAIPDDALRAPTG